MGSPEQQTKTMRTNSRCTMIKAKGGQRTSSALVLCALIVCQLAAEANSALVYHYQPAQLQPTQQNGFMGGLPSSQHHPLDQQAQSSAGSVQHQNLQLQQQQQQASLLLQSNANDNSQLPIDGQPTGRAPPSQPMSPSRGFDRDSPIFRYHGFPLNSSTVKLLWNLYNGHHPDYFEIKYGPIPDATEVYSINLNGTARDFTITQLQPDTLYQFRLAGFHNERSYKPLLVIIKTPPANFVSKNIADYINRDIMPLGVKAEAKSNNSIQLSWTEPDKPNNIQNSTRVNIIRYYINSAPLGSMSNNDNTNESSNNNNNNSSAQTITQPQYHYLNVTNAPSRLIVQRLKPATEYAFAIKTAYYSPDMKRIFTQSGFSMDTLAKTFDIEPSPPRNFTIQVMPQTRDEQLTGQTAKLELNWLPPESPNGVLKGYSILYAHQQQAPEEQWQRISVNESNINNWYIANLKPGLSYYFKMRALNQRGASGDSEIRSYVAPSSQPPDKIISMPIPANNVLMLIVICMIAILFLLFLVVSRLACRTRKKPRKGSLANRRNPNQSSLGDATPKLNGFASTNSTSSTVAGRVGTLARRRNQDQNNSSNNKPDFWINAMEQQQEIKSNISEKSNSDMNMAMVSIQRDSPQFATTQLAPALPEYRFATGAPHTSDQQLIHQIQQQQQQQQSHYHPGQFAAGTLVYDQMDNATASALMTLSKRQQQQLQKYQIQFAATGPPTSGSLTSNSNGQQQTQAPSPHQQPPPPPPLNIEQQHHHHQPVYGTHQAMANTRSLRLHRPTLYDPVSGSFLQSSMPNGSETGGPPNYNSHTSHHHHMNSILSTAGQQPQFHNNNNNNNNNININTSQASHTLQFHPHQTSTLLSRRSTNTLRSFQSSGATYGQLGGNFAAPPQPPAIGQQQQPQFIQNHQAVINQLNNSTYPSLPLKHVSAVRPQIMSSLEDQIEMELAEKEQQQQQQQSGQLQSQEQQQQQQQQQSIKQ